MIVRLTNKQVLRLKYIALQEMEHAGFDDKFEDFQAWNEILHALEEAAEEK